MKIKRSGSVYQFADKQNAEVLFAGAEKQLAGLQESPVPEPAPFDVQCPEKPAEPESYDSRVANIMSYGGGEFPKQEDVDAEFAAYDYALAAYNIVKANYDKELETYNQMPEVRGFKEYQSKFNETKDNIKKYQTLLAPVQLDEIVLGKEDTDEHGQLTQATKDKLLQIGLSQIEVQVLDAQSKACHELYSLCNEYSKNPYIAVSEKRYIQQATDILTKQGKSPHVHLSLFKQHIESPFAKAGRTESFLLFMKKCWDVIKNFFKPTEQKNREIKKQYQRQGTSSETFNSTFSDKTQAYQEDLKFIKNKANAEKQFIKLFDECLKSKDLVSNAVKRREICHSKKTLYQMEEAGYFDSTGKLKEEFKKDVDFARIGAAEARFGLVDLSDKAAIILEAVYYEVNTKICENLESAQAALLQETVVESSSERLELLRSRIRTYAEISSESDQIKKYFKDNKDNFLTAIRALPDSSPEPDPAFRMT